MNNAKFIVNTQHILLVGTVVVVTSLRVWKGDEWNLLYLCLPSGFKQLSEGVESAKNAQCWEPEKSGHQGKEQHLGRGLYSVGKGQLWVTKNKSLKTRNLGGGCREHRVLLKPPCLGMLGGGDHMAQGFWDPTTTATLHLLNKYILC